MGRGNSDQLEDTLTRLMDGISEISQSGHETDTNMRGRREEQDYCSKPSLRSPTSSVKESGMPFGTYRGTPSTRTAKIVGGIVSGTDATAPSTENHTHTSATKTSMPKMHLSIKKNLLQDYKPAPTSNEVRASTNKKFVIGPLTSPTNRSMISEQQQINEGSRHH